MLCPKCNSVMKTKMHFEQDRNYQFHECKRCHERTKNKRIHFEDFLNEEIYKRITSTN